MEAEVKERGMSKGCVVGLIVAGVILVLIIAFAVTCWIYRDDAMHFALNTMLNGAKTELTKESYGMDTVAVNKFIDTFAERIDSVKIDDPATQDLFQTLSQVASDGKLEEAELQKMMEAMANYYPDMRPLIPVKPVIDSVAHEPQPFDSLIDTTVTVDTIK